MTRRQCTRLEESKRKEVDAELSVLAPISPEVRELMTVEGFARWFGRMKTLYPTYEEAYEALESHYQRLTGRRRYSEYSSFRLVYNRKCNKVSV